MISQPNKKRKIISNSFIGNYHLASTELAMAEAITYNSLQTQITQHGLGTGVYGFIDYSENNTNTKNYKLNGWELTEIGLVNPLILKEKKIIDGEVYTDLGNFTWLSMNLNILCFELYNNKKSINKDNIIEIFNKNHFFQDSNNYYSGIHDLLISIDDIIWVVKSFISDYNYLMPLNELDEFYVFMPINYLMYYYKFDGILNYCDDSGRTGSVKYFFNNEYGARGYRPNFKRRDTLSGNLIFLHI